MKRPKITVLMSVFNSEDFLPAAVESILGQSYGDFEFLIIDDGSDQPIDHIIRTYKDNRIVLISQENMGLTRALNKGLRLARGAFVARMDADDMSTPDRLKVQIAAFDEAPDLDLVGSFFDVVDAAGQLIERKELITDPVYRLWRLQFHNNYGHGTVMFRMKAVLKAGLYHEGLRYAQDYDLWSRLSRKNNTRIVPEVLYRYRMIEQGQQASVKNYDAQLAAAILITDRNLKGCNPDLVEAGGKEVRALYWKFQLDHVSPEGVAQIPKTLEGFCRKFDITGVEKKELFARVAQDVFDEIDRAGIFPIEKAQSIIDSLRLEKGLRT
jgi:glycosyltransferase involved in cell wall biosynthesis